MRDEKALRKPEFIEGVWITLADGQKWSIRKPKMRFTPKIVDGRVEIGGGATFGPEFDGAMDVLFGESEVDGGERFRLKFEMAVRLLLANYDLSPADLAELIVYEPGDDASDARWEELTRALMGLAPKPSPAT